MPVVHILVLAAGASSRMRGRDKLLQPIMGQPILRRVAEAALGTGNPVLVTLPPALPKREQALAGLSLQIVAVPDADLGMSRSIARGVAAVQTVSIGPKDGIMILPADMPGLSATVLSDLIARFQAEPDHIWRGGTDDGRPGHPAIFPRDLWQALERVTGDEGGRSVLQARKDRVRQVPLPGDLAVLDLDTPEDWADYLSRPKPSP